jgi:hydroxypyruvate isomerase
MSCINRREFLSGLAVAPVTAGLASAQTTSSAPSVPPARKGRLKQCVMRFNFPANTPFEEMCRTAANLGFEGFDLTSAPDWPILKKYGLRPTLTQASVGTTFENGLIRKELHDKFEQGFRTSIDQCVEIGCPNLIAIPGQRRGMSYEEGADNCVAIFNRVKAHAEDKGITLCIEITNTRDRPDQIFDRLKWGFDVCRRVNSPRVKVLFDIYHAQMTDGDVTHHIRENFALINHFHTAGVPGRNEIDGTQELNYRFIVTAIADLGYTGYIAHEFRPGQGRNHVESLTQARDICTA